MELGYILLALDAVLGVALWAVYRARRRPEPGLELRALREERAALEHARRAALAAAEEALAARAELERTIRRAERVAQHWATGALREAEKPNPEVDVAQARVVTALRALRR